jgi:hypothetical protein
MSEISEIFERTKLQRVARNQRELLKAKINERLTIGRNGGMFSITPELIMFVKLLLDEGKKQHPLLDKNGYPVMIEDMQEFYDDILGRFTEVTNEAWVEHKSIRGSSTVEELLETEIEKVSSE